MPQYYPTPDNWHGRGKVTITYKPAWRNSFLGRLVDYHVGDKVKFHVHAEKPNANKSGGVANCVFELFGGTMNKTFIIDDVDTLIEGGTISRQCSVSYHLGISHMGHQSYELEPFFTAEALNWDTVRLNWTIFIAGVFVTIIGVVMAWALQIIRVNPAWEVWWR